MKKTEILRINFTVNERLWNDALEVANDKLHITTKSGTIQRALQELIANHTKDIKK